MEWDILCSEFTPSLSRYFVDFGNLSRRNKQDADFAILSGLPYYENQLQVGTIRIHFRIS